MILCFRVISGGGQRLRSGQVEFKTRGAYCLNVSELKKVGETIVVDGRLNTKNVWQTAPAIAEMSGISVPEAAKVLIGEVNETNASEPFAHEKLSPVLAMYVQPPPLKTPVIKHMPSYLSRAWAARPFFLPKRVMKNASLISAVKCRPGAFSSTSPHLSGPSVMWFNFRRLPSLTLGCGSWGGNAVSENVNITHLLNIKQ